MATRAQARRESSDPRRRAPSGGLRSGVVAPLVAFVGLLLGALISLQLLSVGVGTGPGGPGDPGPGDPGSPQRTRNPIVERTPDPSVVVTPPPERGTEVRGTLLFARTGNIWAASGRELRQITNRGTDSYPVWSPDGDRIYFIETKSKLARVPYEGREAKYTLEYPVIMSVAPDGSGRTEVQTSLFKLSGGSDWFYWLLQPDLSPDGRTFAVVSDAPDAIGDITLSTVPATGGRITNLGVRSAAGLGHNDPAWSPDGERIAFTYNAREGNDGAPRIGIYTVATRKVKMLRGTGYAAPSWSPDGRFIAAERTSGRGRDIVILDAANGSEVARPTTDGRSFSPVFSPDGTQIAYLHLEGVGVDLRLMTFDPSWTLLDDKAVTEDGSLDAGSPPAWFFPPELRPTITPPPAATPGASVEATSAP
jgi:Tol biopolymer transport system component